MITSKHREPLKCDILVFCQIVVANYCHAIYSIFEPQGVDLMVYKASWNPQGPGFKTPNQNLGATSRIPPCNYIVFVGPGEGGGGGLTHLGE